MSLHPEKIEELRQEAIQEQREEPMHEWINDNYEYLQERWFESQPIEDQPLDDDIPDCLDFYADEIYEFGKLIYLNEVEK